MTNEYILKSDLLRTLDLRITKWTDLKSKEQDVTQENFIDNMILALRWVVDDVENM